MKTVRAGVFETNSSSSHSLTLIRRPELGRKMPCTSCGKECGWFIDEYTDYNGEPRKHLDGDGWQLLDNVTLCEECVQKLVDGDGYGADASEIARDLEAVAQGLLSTETQSKEVGGG